MSSLAPASLKPVLGVTVAIWGPDGKALPEFMRADGTAHVAVEPGTVRVGCASSATLALSPLCRPTVLGSRRSAALRSLRLPVCLCVVWRVQL